jgi:hypothetical protein
VATNKQQRSNRAVVHLGVPTALERVPCGSEFELGVVERFVAGQRRRVGVVHEWLHVPQRRVQRVAAAERHLFFEKKRGGRPLFLRWF